MSNKQPIARVRTEIVFELLESPASPRWVYVIFCEQTNLAKIGIADEYQKRIRDIQATSPTKLELLFAFPVESQEVETFLHQTFSKYRMRGEWFQFSPVLEAELKILQMMFQASSAGADYVDVRDIDCVERFKLTSGALIKTIPEDADPQPYIDAIHEAIADLEARDAFREYQRMNDGAYDITSPRTANIQELNV